jgi:hypothetical protein
MHHNNTITTNHRSGGTWLGLILILFALSNLLSAHGGFDHVIGTVVKIDNQVLTVKTAKGDVDVKLTDKTEITKSDQRAQAADLKPGTRVVVDVPEGSKDRIAHSVKVGVSGAADAHAHSPQK